jgi:predicted deacylase
MISSTRSSAAAHLVRIAVTSALALLAVASTLADIKGRAPSPGLDDPCGLPDTTTAEYRLAAALNWGYSFDSLKADLTRWRLSAFVHIDSIGATVQNRPIYMMTIQDTLPTFAPRKRVWFHARTHPNEVQGTRVTNQIIAQLLGTSALATKLRTACVFNIVPMINPDGVELAKARQNANNIDIESNWTAVPGEPEVQTLRRTFTSLMATENPIRIALNMHSAYGESRYFVYHTDKGTSPAYALIEQRFINSVRSYFPGGIQPYTYFVSWTSAPAQQYPESWFWLNHGANVIALTYEDMNSVNARAFDSTATAILSGIADELAGGAPTDVIADRSVPATFSLDQNYPNPFNPSTSITLSVAERQLTTITIYDLLGQEVATLLDDVLEPGRYTLTWDARGMASGTYICRAMSGGRSAAKTMLLLR